MKNNRGFSLVEVILVICLLGLLGAIAVPNITGISRSSSIKSDKTLGARIGNAFVTRELDGYKIDVGKQEKYSTVSNIAPYIPTNIKPDVLDGGYYVVTKVQYEGRPVILVGITNGTDLIGKKDIYDGKKSGWVWSSYGDLEDFLDGLNWTQQTITDKCNCCGDPINSEKDYCTECENSDKCDNCRKRFCHKADLCNNGCGYCEGCCSCDEDEEQIEQYIIEYNANGGTGSMTSQTGSKVTIKDCEFINSPYEFDGWATQPSEPYTPDIAPTYGIDTQIYYPNQEITLTDNLTLYAMWVYEDSEIVSGSGGDEPTYNCPSCSQENVKIGNTYCNICGKVNGGTWICSIYGPVTENTSGYCNDCYPY